MYRFAGVHDLYKLGSQTADIDASLVWDDVYAALEPHGVNRDGCVMLQENEYYGLTVL